MKAESLDLWMRANRSLKTATSLIDDDPDSAASRAWYAAFNAVSALFALNGMEFSKHAAVEAAVHRDLVHPKIWSADLGSDFSWLVGIRSTGDYGGPTHATAEEARSAVQRAERIIAAVRKQNPEVFI
jgi:uncharacterized protein (UPF0332 family)